MVKKIALSILTIILVSSCSIQGLTSDFGKLNENQKSKIILLTSFEKIETNYIYKINGVQLKQELKKYPKSIVYIFKNGCTSDLCKPLLIYENYAKKNDFKLFLVMDGYAELNETLEQPISSPLFVINNEYYKSNIRANYSRYFENEITSKPLHEKNSEYLGSLYFFNEDKLDRILKLLPKE